MRSLYRALFTVIPTMALAIQPMVGQMAFADGGDFALDFVAAAPLTYDHATGGGAYNDRTVGNNKDIVESLEGGDFSCGDIVTFLTQIRVDAGASGAQSARLRYEFTAYATGQQGIALVDNDTPVAGGVSAAINSSVLDTGTVDDGGSTASVFSESISGAGIFIKPTLFTREVDVTDLEAGETVVLRTDVKIVCNGQSPTGNMQARLSSASVIAPSSEAGAINVGDQTIPFKRVGNISTCGVKEICGNKIDDDCNGKIDDGCPL